MGTGGAQAPHYSVSIDTRVNISHATGSTSTGSSSSMQILGRIIGDIIGGSGLQTFDDVTLGGGGPGIGFT